MAHEDGEDSRRTTASGGARVKALPLRTLQRWFALTVEHPATAEVAIRSRAADRLVPRGAIDEVVRPSARMTPAQMLQVYNGGYLARLVEVMQGDFGAVQHVMGVDAFREVVARYLVPHPSRHPNLNQLGRAFPTFLARQKQLPHRAFLAELAQLERTLCDAFDAPEFAPMATTAMAEVPAERWGQARFTGNPSVHLLAFRHPVDVFYQAWKDGEAVAVPAPARSWLCVHRKGDVVWRQRLQQSAHGVLASLLAGQPLATALARAGATDPVTAWFQGFAQEGLFTEVSWRARRGARSSQSRRRN